jgi:ABC-type branched-subunit amino acid transport system ATPase component
MSALLETRGLDAGYGGAACVRGVDLSVAAGEVAVLLGPNGAGKTTTLRTLAGVLPRIAGEVLFDGALTTAPLHRRARRGLGFVPEERSVVTGLSARDNLRLGRGGVDAAVEMFPELRQHLNRRAGLLSGGQQQMLSLARVLAAQPRVLLADELSLGLAPMVVRRLLASVRAAADRGVGVLMVEQHARQALEIADRAYVMRRGRIELCTPASELRSDLGALQRHYLDVS